MGGAGLKSAVSAALVEAVSESPFSHVVMERSGLLAAGNFIVDRFKIIDYYPREEMLASILRESSGNGGGPYNILKDLAKMGADFPLAAAGLLGDDETGESGTVRRRIVARRCESARCAPHPPPRQALRSRALLPHRRRDR